MSKAAIRCCVIGLGLLLALIASDASGAGSQATQPMAVAEGQGLCFIYHEPPLQDLAQGAGARFNRWQFTWAEIEPSPGIFDFGTYDARVASDRARGFQIEAILMGTPSWAATAGSTALPVPQVGRVRPNARLLALTPQTGIAAAGTSPPKGLYLPWNDPGNVWGRFVYTIASRYRNDVTYWEVWNEPDLGTVFWSGSKADYYQLLKVAYQAAKAANPNAVVLFAGLAYWTAPSYFEDILKLMAADPTASANNHYFDISAWHWYSRPLDAYDKTLWVRQTMQHYGLNKPIWINEAGVPVWNEPPGPGTPYPWSATAEEQASYIIQHMAYALAAGAEKTFIFRLHDADMSEAYGIVRNDYSPRPAFTAYQVATTYLFGATSISRVPQGNIERIVFANTPRGKVTVVWNTVPTPTMTTLPATVPTATLVDKAGQIIPITAQDGGFTLYLPGATANNGANPNDYIIGGNPYLLIEALPAPTPTPTLISATMPLATGWNLVALPISTTLTAEGLLQALAAQGITATQVARWHAGGWDSHPAGLPLNDFPIQLYQGYFVRAATPGTWTVSGQAITTPQAINLAAGWNLIAIPYSTTLTAESLGQNINAQGGQVQEVAQWYAGGWSIHIVGLPFNDFPIQPGRGYFVRTNRPVTWFPPGPP